MPFEIHRVDARAATDPALLGRLAAIVNAAYAIGEAGMWRPGTERIAIDEVAALAAAGELLIAETPDEVLGCVRVHRLSGTSWGFGMLAVDPALQGGGSGRALVDAAERVAIAAGAMTMQLELLVPVDGPHPAKTRLHGWYTALGYARLRSDALEDHHPQLVPLLTAPCTYEIWQKPLAPR